MNVETKYLVKNVSQTKKEKEKEESIKRKPISLYITQNPEDSSSFKENSFKKENFIYKYIYICMYNPNPKIQNQMEIIYEKFQKIHKNI